MENFIVTIRKHRVLGYLLTPDTTLTEYTKPQQKIVETAEKYSESRIAKTFGGNKFKNSGDFFNSLTEDYISKYIRPGIEKKICEILDICRENGIKLYFKDSRLNKVVEDDEVIFSSQNAEAVFNFQRDEKETRYFLSARYKNKDINLFNKAAYILSDNPCRIVIGQRLYFFDGINAAKLIPFFQKKYISVAKNAESQYYQKFVKNIIASGAAVRAEGFEIRDEKVFPEAVLATEKDLTGMTIFQLYFRYNGIDFKPGSETRNVAKYFSDEKGGIFFTLLRRDTEFEENAVKTLTQIFPVTVSEGVFTVFGQTRDPYLQNAAAISTLSQNKEKLLEAGILIEGNGKEKSFYSGKIDLSIKIAGKEDWFDIYAMVCLEGLTFPFISLKHHILNNIREFQLSDGRFVILPEEWFERYRDFFSAGVSNKEDGFVRLKKYQFAVLETLPGEKNFKDKIREMREKISDPSFLSGENPKNVSAVLRPYQTTAFNWLKMMRNYGFGACLADDMGLGKTLCTLSLLSESQMQEPDRFQDGMFSFPKKTPSLLLVPKSLIYNWKNEAAKFVPEMKILEFTGQNRAKTEKLFPLYDLIIACYATLISDVEIFCRHKFNYIILDESQTVKNPLSKTYQSLMQLDCYHRIALTGTPVENSLTDLWSQLNFLNPGLLGTLTGFKRQYATPIEKNSDKGKTAALQKLTKPFILRRTKQQVLSDLPELTEQTIYCEMSDKQKEIYEKEKSKVRNNILEMMEGGVFEKSSVLVLQALTKLRLTACSPALSDENSEAESGKTPEIISMLETVINQGHKVLVFSSFVKHLGLISAELDKNDIEYAVLTGSTKDREAEVKKFETSGVPVFLISIKAGGTGLNLTGADYVFIIDPWWNPAVEAQAVARAHRIGQKNSVMVYRFISKDTIEEKIQRHQQKKTDLAENFVPSKQEILEFL